MALPAKTQMAGSFYYSPPGGLPPQSQLTTDRAHFTEAYAFIPKGVMSDIVTSFLPFWEKSRFWVLARPLSGFAETFSWQIAEVTAGGGSERPELDAGAEAVLFLVEGGLNLILNGKGYDLLPGSYVFIPAGSDWVVKNKGAAKAVFHWVRKRYDSVDGLASPEAFVVNETDLVPQAMPDTAGVWATTRFVNPDDLRHDMHVNLVTFQPGGVIPFAETHVMEHGIYILEGKAVYLLNQNWVEVEAGDFLWLRAFCPQACYAGGSGAFRYLLYKDVNRPMRLG